jgi:hypothetical protein
MSFACLLLLREKRKGGPVSANMLGWMEMAIYVDRMGKVSHFSDHVDKLSSNVCREVEWR